MKKKNKIEVLKYNISRFDHYYATVNFKSSFLIIANITILGFLLSDPTFVMKPLMYLIAFISVLTILFVLLAIKPYLKSPPQQDSNIFFGDIAHKEDTFSQDINQLTNDKYIDDLIKQNMSLANGLQDKFSLLNYATITFVANILIYLAVISYNLVKI